MALRPELAAQMAIAIVLPEPPDGTENICQPVKLWMLILSVVLTVLSAVIYVAIFFSGTEFKEIFQGFGAELPQLTRFFLVSYQYFGVLILIGLVPCVLLLRNRKQPVVHSNRLFMLVFASFGISLFVLSASVIAAYMPVFELGAPVVISDGDST
jgi:hypothetical protein